MKVNNTLIPTVVESWKPISQHEEYLLTKYLLSLHLPEWMVIEIEKKASESLLTIPKRAQKAA